jgi:transketolase
MPWPCRTLRGLHEAATVRKALINALVELAERDPRVLFLTADLGYTVVEPFAERFPDRFFNVGVSEQNMIGMATGLAEGGFIPYVYSIATFSVLRPYEFIRNGPVLQKLPVRIIGVGGGFEYAPAGPTHYALEDVGALRMQPGLHVVTPADSLQCRNALLSIHDLPGPAYFRLGKDENYVVPSLDGRFESGRAHTVRHGVDVLFIAMGPSVALALDAANQLALKGLQSTVMLVSSMSPAPIADLKQVLSQFPFAITVEAHYATGGLGSLICEVVAEENFNCRIIRCGVTQSPAGVQGNQEYMNRLNGLSADNLILLASKHYSEIRSGRASAGTWIPKGDWGAILEQPKSKDSNSASTTNS